MTLAARAASRSARWLLLCALGFGCTRNIELGSDQVTGGTGGSGGFAGAADGGAAGSSAACEPVACRGTLYACGDCDDNDQDGRTDAEDEECTGPCDNREDSLAVGLPGENSVSCVQDCYFDRGVGVGKDGCRISQICDPLSIAPDYPPSGKAGCAYDENAKVPGGVESCAELESAQPDSCAEICGPLTPNGCDCFGCCELPAGSGSYVWLGSSTGEVETCTTGALGDPHACRPCTPVRSCLNDCKPCEICVGRPEPLPTCDDPTASPCAAGYTPCGGTVGMTCQASAYCVTGCCIPEPR